MISSSKLHCTERTSAVSKQICKCRDHCDYRKADANPCQCCLPRLPESFQYTYGLQHCTTGSEAVPTSSESRPPEYSDIHFPSKNPSDVLSFPGSTFFYSTANAVRHSFFLMYIIAPPFLSFQIFQLILPLFSIFST